MHKTYFRIQNLDRIFMLEKRKGNNFNRVFLSVLLYQKSETVKAMPISRVKRCNSEDSTFFRFCINKTPFLRDKIDFMLDLL